MDLTGYFLYRFAESRYYLVEALNGSRSEFLLLTLFVYALVGILAAYMAVILVASLKKPREPAPLGPGLPPMVTVIVACLNEEDVIVPNVEAVTRLDYPRDRLQIVYVYDRGTDRTPEILEDLSCVYPIEVVENASGDRSKAGAINHVLRTCARGSFIAVYDADTRPAPANVWRAVRSLAEDPTIALVNGRRRIMNPGASLLSRLVSMEYHALYRIEHYGRPVSGGVALFYGSNGFFRRDALEAVAGFDSRMLVEDIDCGFRLLEAGWRVVYDPLLEELDEAPPDLASWWHQRMRWARGWIQVVGRHLPLAVARLRGTNRVSAALMLVLIPSPLVVVPVLSLLVPFFIVPAYRREFFQPLFWIVVWTLPVAYFMTSWFHDARRGERRWAELPIVLAVVPMIGYFMLRAFVMWKAFLDHARGRRQAWTKTARVRSVSPPQPPEDARGEAAAHEAEDAHRKGRPLPR